MHVYIDADIFTDKTYTHRLKKNPHTHIFDTFKSPPASGHDILEAFKNIFCLCLLSADVKGVYIM